MRKIFCFALVLFFSQLVHAQNCKCGNDQKKIQLKNRIVLCGTLEKSVASREYTMSGITVQDCATSKYLLNSEDDETTNYNIKVKSDSIYITEMQLIPDSKMSKLILTPLSYRIVYLQNGNVLKLTKTIFSFIDPKLNLYQKKYLDSLCNKIKSHSSSLDELSIYALFLGAVNNYRDCRNLFINLDKYYDLDGANKETKDEIPFGYILEHRRGAKK